MTPTDYLHIALRAIDNKQYKDALNMLNEATRELDWIPISLTLAKSRIDYKCYNEAKVYIEKGIEALEVGK